MAHLLTVQNVLGGSIILVVVLAIICFVVWPVKEKKEDESGGEFDLV